MMVIPNKNRTAKQSIDSFATGNAEDNTRDTLENSHYCVNNGFANQSQLTMVQPSMTNDRDMSMFQTVDPSSWAGGHQRQDSLVTSSALNH